MKSYNWLFALLAVVLVMGMLCNAIVTNNRIMEHAEHIR